MKTEYKIFGTVIFATIGLSAGMLLGMRSCNNWDIKRENLESHSRATGLTLDKIEYTKLSDNSEEIVLREDSTIKRYQNFDADDKIDRIRIEKFKTRDVFGLETVLIRDIDFSTSQEEFNNADKTLLQQRAKYTQ